VGDDGETALAVVDDDGPGVARDVTRSERRRRRSLNRLQRTTGPSSNADDNVNEEDDEDDEENEVADTSVVAASQPAAASASIVANDAESKVWRSTRERTKTNRLSPTFKPQKRSDRDTNNNSSSSSSSSKRQRTINSSKSATSAFEQQWENRYELLVEYKSTHGTCAMPASYKVTTAAEGEEGEGGEGGAEVVVLLGRWLENQKAFHKKGKLLSERYERLINIGVDFGEDIPPITSTKTPTPPSMSSKPMTKKGDETMDAITTPTTTATKTEGFSPNKLEERWKKNLKLYIRGNNYSNDDDETQHKRWIENQRLAYRAGTLTNDRHVQLTNANFDFGSSKVDKWNANYSNLLSYQKLNNGSCNVPLHHVQYPKLGKWVRKQRTLNKNNTLLIDRYDRLNAIGFWNNTSASSSGEEGNENEGQQGKWKERKDTVAASSPSRVQKKKKKSSSKAMSSPITRQVAAVSSPARRSVMSLDF
jgi:hypothetical protein